MTKPTDTEVSTIIDGLADRIGAVASAAALDERLRRDLLDAAYLVRTIAEVPFRREGDAETLIARIKRDATFIADLDGEPFRAYYCAHCGNALRVQQLP